MPSWRLERQGVSCDALRMTKLVLVHKAASPYEDQLDTVYDFPKAYLRAISEAVGDWIVYYEPVKAGGRGYFGAAKIEKVVVNPKAEGRFLALMEPNMFLPFENEVPRLFNGAPLERMLADENGLPKKGGAVQLAVRRLHEAEFEKIVDMGLPADLERIEAKRFEIEMPGLAEEQAPFDRPVIERLTRRPYRDVAFRRRVRRAYGFRCAFSGLMLRNGGGRPEVQAAHIRPVKRQGSDSTRNGLALSGTLHWMFDRGLITVADDHSILVSRNKVPSDVSDRLLRPSGKLLLPDDPRNWPAPENLR